MFWFNSKQQNGPQSTYGIRWVNPSNECVFRGRKLFWHWGAKEPSNQNQKLRRMYFSLWTHYLLKLNELMNLQTQTNSKSNSETLKLNQSKDGLLLKEICTASLSHASLPHMLPIFYWQSNFHYVSFDICIKSTSMRWKCYFMSWEQMLKTKTHLN